MEFYEREFLIYRISAGYLKYKLNQQPTIFIYSPDIHIKYAAQEVYIETYNEAVGAGVLTDDEMLDLMIDNNLWSNTKEELLKTVIPDRIELLKVEIYKANTDTLRREELRTDLRKVESQLSELISQRHQFDYVTCHGIATYAKLNFIIANCSKQDDKPCNWEEVDIHKVTEFVNNHIITERQFRDLAKNEPWCSIWASSKKNSNLFGKQGLDLSDDQRRLVSYSSFYDNIYEHHECPHESIIDDDDMLDGWVILQKQEREKSQNIKMIESKITNPKIANSQEIFIPVTTTEDAKKVDSANDKTGKRIKQQRLNVLAQGQPVEDTKFADVRQDLIMKANEQYINTVKGKGR